MNKRLQAIVNQARRIKQKPHGQQAFEQYEQFKRRIAVTARGSMEYEQAIREVAKSLGI